MLETLFSALVALLAGLVYLYLYLYRARALTSTSTFTFSDEVTPTNTLKKTKPELGLNQEQEEDGDLVSKEPDVPPDWLTSPRIFELEKRAIFSKILIPLTLSSRLGTKSGTYLTLNLASNPLILILGKDAQIRAFHNVCRHRAYPVTTRESGCSTVLSCRYHGWSYNVRGELIRAPQFEGVRGFEKASNGLFGVRTAVRGGVVWGCLSEDGREQEEDRYGDRERQGLEGIGIGEYSRWLGGGTLGGVFNWKGALHLALLTNALKLDETPLRPTISLPQRILSYIQHKSTVTTEPVYLFPNMFLIRIPISNSLLSLSFSPLSASTTSVRYDLYSSENQAMDGTLSRLQERIKSLVAELETGYQGSSTADLNPQAQTKILTLLQSHQKLEKLEGRGINPAVRQMRRDERYEVAEKLCAELEMDCSGGDAKAGSLAW
ncbi:Rieske [2Fe-2S] iron-sulfur domain-containing protein [Aspergillus oleicola]